MVFICVMIGLFALDLGLKGYIETMDGSRFPKRLGSENGKIILYQNHNPGFSFGFLKEKKELVTGIVLAVASGFTGAFFCLLPQKGETSKKLALAVLLGGAWSNLYDRLTRGYVVDYFSFDFKRLKKVVFNLGDLCIFAGSAAMVLTETAVSLYNLGKNIKNRS